MPVSAFAHKGPPDRCRLEALAGSGAKLIEIAVELECSIATVRYWLRKWEIPRPDCRRSDVDPALAPLLADRACPKHGLVSFRLDPRGTYRCKLCRQEQVADRRRRVKRILVDEAGGSCALCGYDRCVAALQFHHRVPAEKRFALSSEGVTRGIDAARAEARKCVLLCANCHAEVEAGVQHLAEAPPGGFEPPRTD
jgi:5-methylcytosine-specific restriction endonuclease McrA